MQDPFCERCGFFREGVFCNNGLDCYLPKVEMIREKMERKRAKDKDLDQDFDPLDYHGTSEGKKAKIETDPACKDGVALDKDLDQDFVPLDDDGTSEGKKAKIETDPACKDGVKGQQ